MTAPYLLNSKVKIQASMAAETLERLGLPSDGILKYISKSTFSVVCIYFSKCISSPVLIITGLGYPYHSCNKFVTRKHYDTIIDTRNAL